jgi:hypothetical protein
LASNAHQQYSSVPLLAAKYKSKNMAYLKPTSKKGHSNKVKNMSNGSGKS